MDSRAWRLVTLIPLFSAGAWAACTGDDPDLGPGTSDDGGAGDSTVVAEDAAAEAGSNFTVRRHAGLNVRS
jgi:hypothetical protein